MEIEITEKLAVLHTEAVKILRDREFILFNKNLYCIENKLSTSESVLMGYDKILVNLTTKYLDVLEKILHIDKS